MTDKEAQSTLRDVLEEKVSEANAEVVTEPVITETPQEKSDRIRDDKGRFADKTPVVDKVVKPDQVEPVAVVDPPAPIPRPSSWRKDMWPVWDKLNSGATLTPQEARQIAEYNSQREQQFATGVSTYKQEAERSKPIMEAIAPYQAEIQQAGAFAPQLIGNLLGAHRTLLNGSPHDKLNFFVQIARDYGIPLQALYDQNVQQQFLASAPQRQQVAPQAPDVNQLVEEALTNRELKSSIETMANDSQKYPFFGYVKATMAQLLGRGEANDLADAYAKALDAPEHSMLTQLSLQQQTQADEQRKLEAQRKTVAVARSNTVSVRSATPISGGNVNGKPSLRAALEEAMSSHAGSARV